MGKVKLFEFCGIYKDTARCIIELTGRSYTLPRLLSLYPKVTSIIPSLSDQDALSISNMHYMRHIIDDMVHIYGFIAANSIEQAEELLDKFYIEEVPQEDWPF